VARIASTVLVVALLAGTAAAFALTQGLKLQKSPIFGTEPGEVFSPVCGCEKEVATIGFKLRQPDRLDVSIVDGDEVVRTIERNRSYPAGEVVVEWDGRDDAGTVLPEGEYEPRVRLRGEHQTITLLGSPIRVDVTPPVLQDLSVPRRVFSPDGDRRRDLLRVRYRLSEPGRADFYVDGERRVRTLFPRTEEKIDWGGRVDGRPLAPGAYAVRLAAFDPAGNRSDRTAPIEVTVRYVALGRKRIVVLAGDRFPLRVSSDARRLRWTLGSRSGFAAPGTLRLLAPRQPGRFTLTLSANGHTARAAVFVREPAR
jgi:hypothetical protein